MVVRPELSLSTLLRGSGGRAELSLVIRVGPVLGHDSLINNRQMYRRMGIIMDPYSTTRALQEACDEAHDGLKGKHLAAKLLRVFDVLLGNGHVGRQGAEQEGHARG